MEMTGGKCPGTHHVEDGYARAGFVEYGGLCGFCWASISQKERDAIRMVAPVVQPVIRILTPPNRFAQVAFVVWQVSVTGAVAWMTWRIKRGH